MLIFNMSSQNSWNWENKSEKMVIAVLLFSTSGTWEESVVGKYTPLHLP
jgi:hypothetical protein